jgi:hypothetical protein
MDFLILTQRGTHAERRVNLHHVVELYRADPASEAAGTNLTLRGGGGLEVMETLTKIDVAIRKLNGKLIAA